MVVWLTLLRLFKTAQFPSRNRCFNVLYICANIVQQPRHPMFRNETIRRSLLQNASHPIGNFAVVFTGPSNKLAVPLALPKIRLRKKAGLLDRITT